MPHHVDSDDMEGQLKWNPLAPDTSWHRQQRLDHVQAWCIAVIKEAAELVQVEAAPAVPEGPAVSPLEVVLKKNLYKCFPDIIEPFLSASS